MPQEKTLVNLVSNISEEKQAQLVGEIVEDFENDIVARKPWEEKRNKWYKQYTCKREPKNTPWPNASNVCLPMLATATNQFHARTYQSIFAAPGLVKTIPVGPMDEDRSKNVEALLNWQTMWGIEDYEEVFDKTLQNLPIDGIAFKKLSWDKVTGQPSASYISPLDVVLPYRTISLEKARRIVHKIKMHYEELLDRNEQGLYENFDKLVEDAVTDHTKPTLDDTADQTVGENATKVSDEPHLILECHKTYDLGDGKKRRPYIFTVHKTSGTLLRVTSREYSEDKAGNNMKTVNHFIDYHFIPNPEGFYSFGFGHFLEQFQEISDTVVNQIIDAGRLSNTPFFFYTRRSGFDKSKIKLEPGKAIEVEDASQVTFPNLPRQDSVLFNVLNIMQGWSDRFTSVTDPLTGNETPGVERPTFGGKVLLIEQGSVQFTVMAKRVFRSLRKELRLMMLLNQLFWPESEQVRIVENEDKIAFRETKREDFKSVKDVIATADPSFASQSIRRQESIQLHEIFMASPTVIGNPELGIQPDIAVITESLKRVEKTYNISTILPDLPKKGLEPEEENALFMQGEVREPQKGEEHLRHLEVHNAFTTKEWFLKMPPDYQSNLRIHMEKTIELAQLEITTSTQLGGGQPQQIQQAPPPSGGQPLQPLLQQGDV